MLVRRVVPVPMLGISGMLVICRQIVVATHVRVRRWCRELLRVVMVARRHRHDAGRVEVRVVVPGMCWRLLAVQLAVLVLVRVLVVDNRLMVVLVLVVPGIRRGRVVVLARNSGRSGATAAFDRPPRGSRPDRTRGRR